MVSRLASRRCRWACVAKVGRGRAIPGRGRQLETLQRRFVVGPRLASWPGEPAAWPRLLASAVDLDARHAAAVVAWMFDGAWAATLDRPQTGLRHTEVGESERARDLSSLVLRNLRRLLLNDIKCPKKGKVTPCER